VFVAGGAGVPGRIRDVVCRSDPFRIPLFRECALYLCEQRIGVTASRRTREVLLLALQEGARETVVGRVASLVEGERLPVVRVRSVVRARVAFDEIRESSRGIVVAPTVQQAPG